MSDELSAGTFCPIIITRYFIDEYGVVHLYGPDDSWVGMTNREGLQYLLDHAPRLGEQQLN